MARNRELILAFLAVGLIGGLYAAIAFTSGTPGAGDAIGHWIGVLGFLLMLATETLYSFRKRVTRRAFGRMGEWLQFHIFTGIVGPFLVLLHSAWSFRGLAGIVTLMMVIVVVSGFIGRYIYTAVPRTPEGVLLEAEDLARLIAEAEASLKEVAGAPVASPGAPSRGIMLILGRRPGELLAAWRRWRALRRLDPAAREPAERVFRLQARLAELRRQVASLATARRLLATWHTIHIPLGMALFVAAFYHIAAGLYFVTLQR